MTLVLVSHPGLQHSHQLARGLYEAGLLQKYWSGIPIMCSDDRTPWYLSRRLSKKLKKVPIPRDLCRHSPWAPLIFRFLARLLAGKKAYFWAYSVECLFDSLVARHVRLTRPSVVVAYEIAALKTFRAAREVGALCILDAASLHHKVGENLLPNRSITKALQRVNARKDEEVELADYILTCSPIAAQSYLDSGVPAHKVVSEPLGADLPSLDISPSYPRLGPVHFIFAGAASRRKSVDIIVAAVTELIADGHKLKISFIGGIAEPDLKELIQACPVAVHIPSLPQADLFAALAECDCLLLPSRFDSFGMVVAEAMACGTPAIVSTQTGAKVMIESFPAAGWIVEPTLASIKSCMQARILDRTSLVQAREAALAAANHFTWAAYRLRIADRIKGWALRCT